MRRNEDASQTDQYAIMCIDIRLFFFFASLTRLGVSVVRVLFVLAVNRFSLSFYVLQTRK